MGIGAMDDVQLLRPQDVGSNTFLSLIKQYQKYDVKVDQFIEMGIMNAMNLEYGPFKKRKLAIFGSSKLKHFGADSYFGHQEIAGTDPKKPIFHNLESFIDEIEASLIEAGHSITRITRDGLDLLKVNNLICVGDNMETDLGQAINVVGDLDHAGIEMIKEVGHIVRRIVKVPRVIAFGGSNVSIEDIESAIFTQEGKYIGVDAPKSGVYKNNYHVEHIGFGVDAMKQVPIKLETKHIQNYFYGKVSNVIQSDLAIRYDVVDTDETFNFLISDLEKEQTGFYFLNIQETDLAGHAENSERYIDRLNLSNTYLKKIRELLHTDDILLVMADHGNDPTIGHSKHTREYVPILIDIKNNDKLVDIGVRETMADVGQTVADFFGTEIEFGTSFLSKIKE